MYRLGSSLGEPRPGTRPRKFVDVLGICPKKPEVLRLVRNLLEVEPKVQ